MPAFGLYLHVRLRRSVKRKARDPMVSHFVITIWNDADGERLFPTGEDFDAQDVLSEIHHTARMCRSIYEAWAIEDSTLEDIEDRKKHSEMDVDGGIHLHVYMECERSIRWSTVRNKFQSRFKGANVQVRNGWRSSAREYCMGMRNGSEKPSLIISGEEGTFRPDSSSEGGLSTREEVASLIVSGRASPVDIATRYPAYFIGNGAGVIRLWETIHRRKWIV